MFCSSPLIDEEVDESKNSWGSTAELRQLRCGEQIFDICDAGLVAEVGQTIKILPTDAARTLQQVWQ